mgnify:CR=1 FL=1
MTHTSSISALIFATALAFGVSSSAMAHGSGGGHTSTGAQHFGNTTYGFGGTTTAAKSVNLGGLSKFVIKNAIQGGKLVGGALGGVVGAVGGSSGKCSRCQ